MKKAVIFVVILGVIGGVLFWKYSATLFNKTPEGPKIINLTYWGLWDEEPVMRPIIENYQNTHPNTKITYVKQSLLNYRTRVQTQLRAGQGPDILEIHNSWLPIFTGDLAAAPDSFMSIGEYNNTFYQVAKESLVSGGKIYAVPTEVDGLALYYNEDILKAAGVSVPRSWQEFVETSKKVTVKNQQGQILTSGAAMGTASNVDFWPEILGLLFLQQPNVNIASPATKDGAEVLQFYTSFVIDPKNKIWDTSLPSSTQMFAEGRLAFYFAPLKKAQVIKETNPALNFKIAPVPQLPGKNMSYGGFWVMAVSGVSANQKEAWEFIKYLSSAEVLSKITTSRAYPRLDMADLQSNDPVIGTFIFQGPYYKSWYLNSDTQDVGINEEMTTLFSGAINAVLQGQDSLTSLNVITPNIKTVLEKYKAK